VLFSLRTSTAPKVRTMLAVQCRQLPVRCCQYIVACTLLLCARGACWLFVLLYCTSVQTHMGDGWVVGLSHSTSVNTALTWHAGAEWVLELAYCNSPSTVECWLLRALAGVLHKRQHRWVLAGVCSECFTVPAQHSKAAGCCVLGLAYCTNDSTDRRWLLRARAGVLY
jgi:hypothetical protein